MSRTADLTWRIASVHPVLSLRNLMTPNVQTDQAQDGPSTTSHSCAAPGCHCPLPSLTSAITHPYPVIFRFHPRRQLSEIGCFYSHSSKAVGKYHILCAITTSPPPPTHTPNQYTPILRILFPPIEGRRTRTLINCLEAGLLTKPLSSSQLLATIFNKEPSVLLSGRSLAQQVRHQLRHTPPGLQCLGLTATLHLTPVSC